MEPQVGSRERISVGSFSLRSSNGSPEATNHISGLLLTDATLTTGHLIPDTTQGIVGKETHHILRRKELVAHRHLSAIARLAARFTHLSALLQGIVILEHPSQGFVLFPRNSRSQHSARQTRQKADCRWSVPGVFINVLSSGKRRPNG